MPRVGGGAASTTSQTLGSCPKLQARGAFVVISAHDDTGAPYCAVDLARCVTPQAQRKPDLENAVEDRVDADDVEQRQRAGPGLNHQNQSEDDREHAARDQKPLVLDLLTQPDPAHDLPQP